MTIPEVIHRLVTAVRDDDGPRVEELLKRFAVSARFEDTMALRAALEADLDTYRPPRRTPPGSADPRELPGTTGHRTVAGHRFRAAGR
jgi:hypothetical protein